MSFFATPCSSGLIAIAAPSPSPSLGMACSLPAGLPLTPIGKREARAFGPGFGRFDRESSDDLVAHPARLLAGDLLGRDLAGDLLARDPLRGGLLGLARSGGRFHNGGALGLDVLLGHRLAPSRSWPVWAARHANHASACAGSVVAAVTFPACFPSPGLRCRTSPRWCDVRHLSNSGRSIGS